jgi:predicted RNase H-like HicB family nuclease
MLLAYLTAAMDRAHYEFIEDEDPYYGEIPGLQGIWATGSSLEACRQNLMAALEDWATSAQIPSLASCGKPESRAKSGDPRPSTAP